MGVGCKGYVGPQIIGGGGGASSYAYATNSVDLNQMLNIGAV